MSHIFISYSKMDSAFANQLADDLIAAGFKIWIDRSIGGGELWRESIEQNLKAAGQVIIVVSPKSMASDWVNHEGSLAYGWDKQLFPILIEPVESLPPWLEDYQWIDFVKTTHDTALNTLVKTLTPPNPIQDLLDQQVSAYVQTGELIGEAILRVIDENRGTLVIGKEAQELITQSQDAIAERQKNEEAAIQRELDQARKMAELELERAEILQQKLDLERSNNLLTDQLLEWVTLKNFWTDIRFKIAPFGAEIERPNFPSRDVVLPLWRPVEAEIGLLLEWSMTIKAIGRATIISQGKISGEDHFKAILALRSDMQILLRNYDAPSSKKLKKLLNAKPDWFIALEECTLRIIHAIERFEYIADKNIRRIANEIWHLTRKNDPVN